jgi:AGCS family alanine or glycine:cation symporter
MEILEIFIHWLAEQGRGWPFVLLLVGTGVYFTVTLGGIQFRAVKKALRLAIATPAENAGKGDVSSFQAFTTVLAGTIGTGNIAGVATAIVFGGPGAIFWMWVTALVAMAIKFAESTLSHKFRVVNKDQEISGGPMYTLKYGLNMPRLGGLFAIFMIIGTLTTGGMVQANSLVDGLVYLAPAAIDYRLWIGVVIAILVGAVVLGGVKRIGKVAEILVPFMALSYCAAAILILILNADAIPSAFGVIFEDAFAPAAIGGGTLGSVIQYGVVRALFTSEAGLGTAPIALAAMRTDQPVQAGLVAMIGPWVDTILISTMTALVIIISGVWGDNLLEGLNGATLSAYAFEDGLQTLGPVSGRLGAAIVGFSLAFFAFSTMLTWCYYGDRSIEYLVGTRWVMPYRIFFILIIIIGAVVSIELVWSFADIANILIAIPNLLSLLLLSGMVKRLTSEYWREQGQEK